MPWIIIVFVILILDILSKWLVIQKIDLFNTVTVINHFFYLTHIRNTGAAWNIFQDNTLFLAFFSIIIISIIIFFILKNKQVGVRLPLTFILGGALGNFCDRVFRGSVVDFIQLHFGNYIFPTFNIADSFICIGVILMLINIIFQKKEVESG